MLSVTLFSFASQLSAQAKTPNIKTCKATFHEIAGDRDQTAIRRAKNYSKSSFAAKKRRTLSSESPFFLLP